MSAAGWARLRERAESGDYEATAVLVILDTDRFRAKADPYVTTGGVDFAGLLGDRVCKPRAGEELHDETCPACGDAPYLSAGERLLVELASNLWCGRPRVDVNGLLATLDGPHLRLALDAIDARSGGRTHHAWAGGGRRG